MELKATNLLIAILLVTLVVGVMINLLARGSSEYGVVYENESHQVYNQLESINNITQQMQNKTENIGTRTGAIDILGGFFNDAYQSLKLTSESYKTMGVMVDGSTESLNLGSNTALFKGVLTAIIIIVIILGIILASVIKRSL